MKVGVVGATGLVGRKLIDLLGQSTLPIETLRLIASKDSKGQIIKFKEEEIEVCEVSDEVFDDLDLIFFMATNDIASQYAKIAAQHGIVIDNSSAFRMNREVPLIVPEVNFKNLKKENRIIANPNCSTIQLVVALHQLSKINKIKRVDVSTYQAVSGAGKEAMDEYKNQIINYDSENVTANILPVKNQNKHYPILDNPIPQIDVFESNGYTKEELKVINESQKIMGDKFDISCTAVRVPVLNGHSESVTVTFENEVDIEKVYQIFKLDSNLIVLDQIEEQVYPLALLCKDKNEVFVGRIRKDLYSNHILHLWVVADNLVKGAAGNALQIAEKCYKEKTFGW